MEFVVLAVSSLTAIIVANLERRARSDKEKWKQNSDDHNSLVNRMDMIGSNLGRSLDRVEENLTVHIARLENKVDKHDEVLFNHLADHAMKSFTEEQPTTKARRKQAKES